MRSLKARWYLLAAIVLLGLGGALNPQPAHGTRKAPLVAELVILAGLIVLVAAIWIGARNLIRAAAGRRYSREGGLKDASPVEVADGSDPSAGGAVNAPPGSIASPEQGGSTDQETSTSSSADPHRPVPVMEPAPDDAVTSGSEAEGEPPDEVAPPVKQRPERPQFPKGNSYGPRT